MIKLTFVEIQYIKKWLKMSKNLRKDRCPFLKITPLGTPCYKEGDLCKMLFPDLSESKMLPNGGHLCPCQEFDHDYVASRARRALKEISGKA